MDKMRIEFDETINNAICNVAECLGLPVNELLMSSIENLLRRFMRVDDRLDLAEDWREGMTREEKFLYLLELFVAWKESMNGQEFCESAECEPVDGTLCYGYAEEGSLRARDLVNLLQSCGLDSVLQLITTGPVPAGQVYLVADTGKQTVGGEPLRYYTLLGTTKDSGIRCLGRIKDKGGYTEISPLPIRN